MRKDAGLENKACVCVYLPGDRNSIDWWVLRYEAKGCVLNFKLKYYDV